MMQMLRGPATPGLRRPLRLQPENCGKREYFEKLFPVSSCGHLRVVLHAIRLETVAKMRSVVAFALCALAAAQSDLIVNLPGLVSGVNIIFECLQFSVGRFVPSYHLIFLHVFVSSCRRHR